MKKWILAAVTSLSGIVLLLIMAVYIYCLIQALVGSEGDTGSGEIAGYDLPSFITEDMMKALFETQEEQGIPVSTGIAQIIQESGFGTYGPGGESGQGLSGLAYNYKNLFGVKYWSGDKYATGSVDMTTGEETSSGGHVTIKAGFSVYKNYGDSIRQRAEMLQKEPYYSRTLALYKNQNDGHYSVRQANSFMAGIGEAWATDSNYYESCKKSMETYNLYQFDNMTYAQYKSNKESGDSLVSDGTFTNPCPGSWVSSEFGPRVSPGGIGSTNHLGRDYAHSTGADIVSITDGTVKAVEYIWYRGNYIVISHGNGLESWYQHCSAIYAKVGQAVKKGQRIAAVGSTGNVTGPHLHIEIHENGTPVDPRKYLE